MARIVRLTQLAARKDAPVRRVLAPSGSASAQGEVAPGEPQQTLAEAQRALAAVETQRSLAAAEVQRSLSEAEALFWEGAATKSFASDEARVAFRELWFGRYLAYAPEAFFIALGPDGDVHGYLAGALVSDAPPLPGPDYFAAFPSELIARYPAHIHVNIRAERRGGGIGAELVRAFAAHCRDCGLPGFHAVTVLGSRSAAFFQKSGLALRATANWRDRDLAFLGLALEEPSQLPVSAIKAKE